MPIKRLQNIGLNNTTYAPGVYSGFTTEQPKYNVNILASSLDKLDKAVTTANEKAGAVDLTLGEIGSKLNEQENAWFNDYKQNIKDQIQAQIDAGNFGDAIVAATRLGTQVASDPQLQAKMKYNADLEAFRKSVNEDNTINPTKRRWVLHKYGQYNYQDEFDDKGNIVGGNTFDSTKQYTASLDWAKEWAVVAQLLPEQSGGKGGTEHNEDLTRSVTSSHEWHIKSADDIRNFMDERLRTEPQLRQQVEEEFNSTMYDLSLKLADLGNLDPNSEEYTNKLQQYEKQRSLITWNDSPVNDYETYYRLMYESKFPELFAYNRRSDTSHETINSSGKKGGGQGGEQQEVVGTPKPGSQKSTPVEIKLNKVDYTSANVAANAIPSPTR